MSNHPISDVAKWNTDAISATQSHEVVPYAVACESEERAERAEASIRAMAARSRAWHEAFGTSKLSEAVERLRVAEAKASRTCKWKQCGGMRTEWYSECEHLSESKPKFCPFCGGKVEVVK